MDTDKFNASKIQFLNQTLTSLDENLLHDTKTLIGAETSNFGRYDEGMKKLAQIVWKKRIHHKYSSFYKIRLLEGISKSAEKYY